MLWYVEIKCSFCWFSGVCYFFFFFFSSRRRHTRWTGDWSSDVCSSDLKLGFGGFRCDAAYKVPAEVWRRLIDAAKAVDPEIVFLAENLGATVAEVEALGKAGFDYLFNSMKWWDFESSWLLEQYEKFRHIGP